MNATNTTRWIGIGLLGLPLYGVLTFGSGLDLQPDPNTHYEAWSRFVTTDHYVLTHVLGSILGLIFAIFGTFALGAYLAKGRSGRLGLVAMVVVPLLLSESGPFGVLPIELPFERPPALDALGLVGALRTHAAHGDHGGPRVSVDAPDGEAFASLPAAVEVAAYLIVLEAVNNADRHADARHCAVRLRLENGVLRLELTDDGRGIGEERGTGVGLSSMRERAAELGGSRTVEALPSGGTRVRASLPCSRGDADTVEP